MQRERERFIHWLVRTYLPRMWRVGRWSWSQIQPWISRPCRAGAPGRQAGRHMHPPRWNQFRSAYVHAWERKERRKKRFLSDLFLFPRMMPKSFSRGWNVVADNLNLIFSFNADEMSFPSGAFVHTYMHEVVYVWRTLSALLPCTTWQQQ